LLRNLLLLSVFFPLGFITAEGQLSLVSSEPLTLRNGAGTARLVIKNSGTAALPMQLTTGVFTDDFSRTAYPSALIDFEMEAGKSALPSQIAAGQSIQLLMSVKNLTGSSSSTATLFNQPNGGPQPDSLGTLSAVAVDTPLKIVIAGDGGLDKPLNLVDGHSAVLTLKNEGTEFLKLAPTFDLLGTTVTSPIVSIGPHGSARLPLTLPDSAYSLADLVRASPHTGFLLLTLSGPSSIDKALLPSLTLPVSVSMAEVYSGRMRTYSTIYVVLFLILGGLLSVLTTSILPNLLTKINLRAQTRALADRTSSVSTRVDSYLRVLLRLERKKIDFAMDDVSQVLFNSTDTFTELTMAIATLSKRLTVAERLDELRRRFEAVAETAPPSITNDLDKTLGLAATQLHSYTLADEDLTAANALLDKADQTLILVNDTEEQAKRIATNYMQFETRLKMFPTGFSTEIQASLPGIFTILKDEFADPKNVVQPMFFAIDHAIAAAHLALDYAMVKGSVPTTVTIAGVTHDVGEHIRARIARHEDELLNLLGTLSWRSLREATTLVQQMREDLYEEDALREMKEHRAQIIFDTQKARPYLPVFFSIGFDNPRYLNAAAVSRLSLHWEFPDGLKEEGWKVCHFFEGDEPAASPDELSDEEKHKEKLDQQHRARCRSQLNVFRKSYRWFTSAFPFDRPGKIIFISVRADSPRGGHDGDIPHSIKIPRTIEVQGRKRNSEYSRFFADATRFLIAFAIALAGLVTGALDQLAKLDFLSATVAIVALGFGANSVKNLLTQTPNPAVVPATPVRAKQ
jgi:hypothetical protein